ncbi:extracellular catalytic domain type 1 short-chain-length polyhydroxyalkanoate depolymerase [Acuticoccus sediminis]|nr:alpha/beta fold hydrolase [Acuticoccus sediminis]
MSLTQFLCVLLIVVVGGMIALARPTSAAVSQTETIQSSGQRRTYFLLRPAKEASPSTRFPVVIFLHGGYGAGRNIANQSGIDPEVARGGFIAAFPNSSGNHWNDGRPTTADAPDDVQFITEVVADIVARFKGDPNRVFVGGMSNGGMMTQRLACEAPQTFRAFASVAANMPEDLVSRCHPRAPVPMLLFSGTDDDLMPFNGGAMPTSRIFGGSGGRVLSANDTFAFWARLAGCSGQSTAALPNGSDDGTTVTRVSAKACGGNVKVELYRIDGGGHRWPGSVKRRGPIARRLLGTTTQDINATSIILNFFRAYGL